MSFINPAKVSFMWHASPTTFHNLRNVTPDKVLRMKPQNLLLNLPLNEA